MLRLFALAGLAIDRACGSQAALGASRRHALHRHLHRGRPGAGQGRRHRAARLSRRRAQGRRASLDVYQRIDRPNQFVVLGAWADQKAYESHSAGDAAKKLNEKLATMLAAPTDTRQHNGLSVAPAKAGKDADLRRHPCRRHPAGEGQRRQRARAACRRQPQAFRQSAVRRLAADQPAQPFHRGRILGQPRRLRRPPDAEGNPRVPHEARRRCRARSTTSGSTRC